MKLGQVNKQGSFLRPLKRKCRCKRDIHSNIHTTRLCFICFLFETFTTQIPQLNFYFSLFFFQASTHFHFFSIFVLFFHIKYTKQMFLFYIFYTYIFLCLLGFSFLFQELWCLPIHFRSPQLISSTP